MLLLEKEYIYIYQQKLLYQEEAILIKIEPAQASIFFQYSVTSHLLPLHLSYIFPSVANLELFNAMIFEYLNSSRTKKIILKNH